MRISLFCVLVVSVACSSFQTSAAENPNAEYCVLVASFNDQRLTMRDQFDAWAQMQKLNVEMVDPQLSVYRDAANSYAINLRINLGRRGVLVALAPSAALAVLGLRSIIEDNVWLNQALLQWMGTSPTPWKIDGEMGDLSGDRLGPAPLLTYARYDLVLKQEWVKKELDLTITREILASFCAIDVPEIAHDLLELGRTAAKKQVQPEHL